MNTKTVTVLRFPVAPMGAPRQTQRDRWAKRPVIERYHAFRDSVRWLAKQYDYELGDQLTIRFFIEMPASWAKTKKVLMDGAPHIAKPDIDNLVKAFCDAFLEDDSHVWHVDARKYWTSREGYIEVEV